MFTLRERTNGVFGAKDTARVFDSYTAILLCLAVILAFGLGYTVGKTPLSKSTSISTNADHTQTFGRFGRVNIP